MKLRWVAIGWLTACGGGGGDGVTQQGDCELDIVVSGGYTWSNAERGAGLGCGTTGADGTRLNVSVYGPDDEYRSVVAVFDPPLQMGQTFATNITLELDADIDEATRASWRSAVRGCTFDVMRNELVADDFFPNKYVIGGTISCPTELAPDPDNTLGAVTVEPFHFQSFDNYE